MTFIQRVIFLIIGSFLVVFVFPHITHSTSPSRLQNSMNIILLTIDTLRPDHLGCYGYKSIKTPNIDGLAENGVLFKNAYSPVPLTFPSHVSIMTGQYPVRHGVHDNGIFILSDSAVTLAELARNHGYKTGAVVASHVLVSSFGLDQGFDYYDDYLNQDKPVISQEVKYYRKGEIVTDLAKKWLRKNYKTPFFLWVHYFDPHTPYDPPSPFDCTYESQPYDGEIAYLDKCLGRLFKEVRKLGLLENTCLVFVGDHGEGLWEHQEQTHGLFIYNSTLRIPLIICCPNNIRRGEQVASLVRTIDITPTILEFFPIRDEKNDLQGTSLIPFLTGQKNDIQFNLYCGSRYPELNFHWAPLEGIVTSDGWKYISAPKPELYNLINDPHEKTNLYKVNRKKAQSMNKNLVRLRKNMSRKSNTQGNAKQISLSPETREKLRSLGYIWAGEPEKSKAKNQSIQSLPDPKDMAPLLAQIDEARELSAKGMLDQAIEKYEKVLVQNPDNLMACYDLGMAYRNRGELKKAVSEIEKVIKLDPHYFDCQNIAGMLYDQLCMPEKAISSYKKALIINPESAAMIHNNLGMVYLKMNDFSLAAQEFQTVFEASNDSVLTSLAESNLGRIYFLQGKFEKALKNFKKSIKLDSANRDASVYLADTYYRLGDIHQAISEWERIIKYWPDDYVSCFRLAQLFLAVGKSRQAIQYLKKCLQLRPDYIDARMLLQQVSQKVSLNDYIYH